MSELRIYHGQASGDEPPKSLIQRAIDSATLPSDAPAIEAGEVVHHDTVEHYRADFGRSTSGQSVVCLVDPRSGDWVKPSDVSGSPIGDGSEVVGALQDALRAEFGGGVMSVVSVDQPHRTVDGTPRALPETLEVER
jgi:hypothetical protein